MDEEKKWMLMTYYCPTHGDLGIVKPIETTKKEISKKFLFILILLDTRFELSLRLFLHKLKKFIN